MHQIFKTQKFVGYLIMVWSSMEIDGVGLIYKIDDTLNQYSL